MNVAEIVREIEAGAAPCVRLVSASTGRSRIGGLPNLGAEYPWPMRNRRAMSFLAQIDLAELRAAQGPEWLPEHGVLFFFYDEGGGSWGFSPGDRGSCGVIHGLAAGPVADLRTPPQPAPPQFSAQPVGMRAHLSLPAPERLGIDTHHLAEADWSTIDAMLFESERDAPLHQVGGWPRPIQNDDMELECQLASNGIDCGRPEGYTSEEAKALAPGASEWRLLLQLDSDDDSDMMWGDSGMLYFWIRESEARAGDFSNVWMILQCC